MRNGKKRPIWPWVLLGSLALLAGGIWAGYEFFHHKKEEITHYSIKKVGIGEMSIAHGQISMMGYAVLNTALPEPLMPDKIDIDIVWNRHLKVKSEVLEPKRSDARVDTLYFKFSNDAKDLLEEIRRQQNMDSSLVEGVIRIRGDIPLHDDSKAIVLKFRQKVKHFKFPKVRMDKLKVDKWGLKKVKLKAKVEITNLDRYFMAVRDIYVKVRLGEDMVVELKNEPDMVIKPHQTKKFEFPLEMDIKKPGKVISKVISNKDVYVAKMYTECKVAIGKTDNDPGRNDNSVWQEFPIKVNQQDTLELMPKKDEQRFAPGQKKPERK